VKDVKAKILENEKISADYYKMTLDAPGLARSAAPGQFVQVRCGDGLDPLLRRPFSIHRISGTGDRLSCIEILYELVGKGTEILSRKQKGTCIDVLGPLGNGFILPLSAKRYPLSAILVAGGVGVAPLVFLAEELARKKIKAVALIGARTKKSVLCDKDFKDTGVEVHIATDDGSRGYKGFVSGLLQKVLRTTNHESRKTVYACGPQPMLKRIAGICREKRLECQVSLEEEMACGFGACMGCAVKVKDQAGYKLACKDGPVFNAAEIAW